MHELLSHLNEETSWIVIGFIGQSLFFMRFFVQWLASEKAGKSVVPVSFWYFSLAGGLTLFIYSLYRQDLVFIFGQCTGIFIYLRNLALIQKQSATTASNSIS